MSVKIVREADGRVSIGLSPAAGSAVTVSPVEARLIAIKLLLAAEETTSSTHVANR